MKVNVEKMKLFNDTSGLNDQEKDILIDCLRRFLDGEITDQSLRLLKDYELIIEDETNVNRVKFEF